jgi:hypothetical protein
MGYTDLLEDDGVTYQQIGDLEVRDGADGGASLRWRSHRSDPPRRLPVADDEMARTAARWFGRAGLVMLVPAGGAIVAGVRLLQVGDLAWGVLAVVAGALLALLVAFTVFMVISMRMARRGDVIALDPNPTLLFKGVLATELQQLSQNVPQADRDAAAARLWELAWNLHHAQSWQSPTTSATYDQDQLPTAHISPDRDLDF